MAETTHTLTRPMTHSGRIGTECTTQILSEYLSGGVWKKLYSDHPKTTTTTLATTLEHVSKRSVSSTITDVVQPDPRRRTFKPVTHDKTEHTSATESGVNPTPVSIEHYDAINRRWYRSTAAVLHYDAECVARQAAEYEQRVSLPYKDYDYIGAYKSAYELMIPRSGDVSHDHGFLVFLAELRDFKSLITVARRPVEFLHKMRNVVGMPKSIGQLIGMLSTAGAEGRLLLKFVVEPLLSDLKQLRDGVVRIDNFIDRWNRDAENGVIYARHRDMSQFLNWTNNWSSSKYTEAPVAYNGPVQIKRGTNVKNNYNVKAIAHLYYRPLPIDRSSVTKARLRFDALGIGNVGSNIWNVIPFSFLVDYFITTDEFFAQFQKDCYEMPYEVVAAGYSCKQKYTTEVTVTCSGSRGQALKTKQRFVRARVPLSGLTALTVPINWDLLRVTAPSLGQWLNVASLIRLMSRRK